MVVPREPSTNNGESARGAARFEDLARAPDDAIDVALGALIVAQDVEPDVDVAGALQALDEMAAPLAASGLESASPFEQVEAISARFRELDFRGNAEDYYDPKNSLLHHVLDRRLGIPITLSVVWCELARRAGVTAHGVGFPGHFLARVDARERLASAPVIVDPFGAGRVVDDAIATELLCRALGEGAILHPSLFAPASPRATLVRLLTNLKTIWASRGDHSRALVAIDRIVTLVPDSARMLRERAGVALRLGIHELARADLARVLELEPQAPDAPLLEKRVAELAHAEKPTLN